MPDRPPWWVNLDDTTLIDHGLVTFQDRPYTGETFELNAEGGICAIDSWQDGRQHGRQRRFFGDGRLRSELHARHGTVIGETWDYHPNGHLACYQSLDEHGELRSRQRWDDTGRRGEHSGQPLTAQQSASLLDRSPRWLNWDDPDIDMLDSSYINCRDVPYTGETFDLDGDGKICTIEIWRNGCQHGVQREFFGDGRLRQEYHMTKGGLVGTYLVWHFNGRLELHQEYDSNGHLDTEERWDEHGRPTSRDD